MAVKCFISDATGFVCILFNVQRQNTL